MDNMVTRLVEEWRRRKRRPRILDAWAGTTAFIEGGQRAFGELREVRGQRYLREHTTGRLIPIIAGGGTQSWEEALIGDIADGTQLSNSTSEALIAPDFTIPGNYMAAGRVLRMWAFGVNSNVVTTPGTLIFRVRWGGLAGTALLVSAAQGLDTTAHTNALWCLVATIVCRSVGSSGTFMSGGFIQVFNLLSSSAANLLPALLGSAGAPGASGNAAVTVDTTTAKALSLTAQFSVSTSPTNLTAQQRIIESLN